MVPLRAGPVFAAAVNRTVPFPVPAAPSVTEIHGALLVAVQLQPAAVCTSNDPDPPFRGTFVLPDDSAKEHPCPCVTVKVRPAIVSAPERGGPPDAATLNRTVPLPDPLAPDVIVTQSTALEAFHPHPSPADTVTVPVPPPASTDWLSGEIEYVQP